MSSTAPITYLLPKKDSAFTLLEVAVVILILGVVYATLIPHFPSVEYWKEEDMLKKLSETISFLHRQAVNDGVYYTIQFDLNGTVLDGCSGHSCYKVGEVEAHGSTSQEGEDSTETSKTSSLTKELLAYLNPLMGNIENFKEPQNFPSLGTPTVFEEGTRIVEIKTMRGVFYPNAGDDLPYIVFSPRSFSEFAVIHIQLNNENNKVTLLVNPFSGLTEIYRGDKFRDFEWTYG